MFSSPPVASTYIVPSQACCPGFPPSPLLLAPAASTPCSDLLRAYAKLQRFRPAPFKSACYGGDLLLDQFAAPYAWDGKAVERAYPWLRGYDAGGCEKEHGPCLG